MVPKQDLPHCRAANSSSPRSTVACTGCALPSALLSGAWCQHPPVHPGLFYKCQPSGSHLSVTSDMQQSTKACLLRAGPGLSCPRAHPWPNPEALQLRAPAGSGCTVECPRASCFLAEQVLLPSPSPKGNSAESGAVLDLGAGGGASSHQGSSHLRHYSVTFLWTKVNHSANRAVTHPGHKLISDRPSCSVQQDTHTPLWPAARSC